MGVTYKQAGVDIDAGNRMVDLIKPLAASTVIPGVMGGLGGFGGLFKLPDGMKEPILVSGCDGVGTKLKVAFATGVYDTVGIDLVAMNVNDVLVCGATPLFFLDYFATGRLSPEQGASVVSGVAEGCRQAGCALLGGETAELPGFYSDGEFELAGFAVGVVDRAAILDSSAVRPGDVVLGLHSTGLHSNGYSLARAVVFDKGGFSVNDPCPAEPSRTVGQMLLTPTRIYVKPIIELRNHVNIKALAHITGGGLLENPPRTLPTGCAIRFDRAAMPLPPLFQWLQELGSIEDRELFRVLNCGVGMTAIVDPAQADVALDLLRRHGAPASVIGEIIPRGQGDEPVQGL